MDNAQPKVAQSPNQGTKIQPFAALRDALNNATNDPEAGAGWAGEKKSRKCSCIPT